VSGDMNVWHVRYKEHASTLTCKEDQCNFMARGISTHSEDDRYQCMVRWVMEYYMWTRVMAHNVVLNTCWTVKDMSACQRVTDMDAHQMGSGHGCTLDG